MKKVFLPVTLLMSALMVLPLGACGTKEKVDYVKNQFVTYTPFDLAAFAAKYGDINDEQNKRACTKLIIDTYETCKEVFGDKKYFFDDEILNEKGYPERFDLYASNSSSMNVTSYVYPTKDESEEKELKF